VIKSATIKKFYKFFLSMFLDLKDSLRKNLSNL